MKYLLIPISLLCHIVISIRHLLFNLGIIKAKHYDIPVICVGNLVFGGTGKTPHVAYLVDLLKDKYHLAVLSRGYGRKTKGFIKLNDESSFLEVGDEPMQFFNNYKQGNNVEIAVDEWRTHGIDTLLSQDNPPQVVLLDDAFQHRYVKAGLNILLTDSSNLYTKDCLFPAGNLRDIRSAAKRADIIVVTKTPKIFSPYTRRDLQQSIKLRRNQKLFFSYYKFQKFVPINEAAQQFDTSKIINILLFTGIANPSPLEEYLKTKCVELQAIQFSDHYIYQDVDIQKIVYEFSKFIGKNNIMVTTEKDAMRLQNTTHMSLIKQIPLFYVPIEVAFHDNEEHNSSFDQEILKYVTKN